MNLISEFFALLATLMRQLRQKYIVIFVHKNTVIFYTHHQCYDCNDPLWFNDIFELFDWISKEECTGDCQ